MFTNSAAQPSTVGEHGMVCAMMLWGRSSSSSINKQHLAHSCIALQGSESSIHPQHASLHKPALLLYMTCIQKSAMSTLAASAMAAGQAHVASGEAAPT